MLTDERFTPWTQCTWLKRPDYGECYFVGRYVCPRRGDVDLWVRCDWSARALRSNLASWEVEKKFSLPDYDPAYTRLRFLNEFVLAHWWEIVTSAPVYR